MSENPPAFPVSAIDGFTNEGMALRDWFAGQALAGFMSSEGGIQAYSENWAAERAYLMADAMLAQRGEPA